MEVDKRDIVSVEKIHSILCLLRDKFMNTRMRYSCCLCVVAFGVLERGDYKLFKKYYSIEVKNRKTFYYRDGTPLSRYDINQEDLDGYYLFKPYDYEKRLRWLERKIVKISKEVTANPNKKYRL